MRSLITATLVAASALAGATTALADAPSRVRGTIVSVSGDTAVIRTPMGKVDAHLTADSRIVGAKKASLDDIKPNSFIGTAAVPGSGDHLRALEVTIFPEAMRGTGEGSYPWDLGKSGSMTNGAVSSMTNGTVAPAAAASSMTNGTVSAMGAKGRTITVAYKGGEKIVDLPDDTPVVTLDPGDRSLLKPGVKVVVFGPKTGDTVEAKRIVAGEDGVKPPM